MKNKIYTLLLLAFVNNMFSQQIVNLCDEHLESSNDVMGLTGGPRYYKDVNNYFLPFIGTWVSPVGNDTFVVTIWKDSKVPIGNPVEQYTDFIRGHFKLVQNYGQPNETIVYTSERPYRNNTLMIRYAFYGISVVPNGLGGGLYDFSYPDNSTRYATFGDIGIRINSGSNPPTAIWNLTALQGLYDEYPVFNVPMNLTLTKIN